VSLLDWEDIIDRNALGFDQLKPPGLAEVAALGADGNPIAPATPPATAAARSPWTATRTGDRGRRPFVHTSIRTTVGALLDGKPIPAQACDRNPVALPAGQEELLISPGAAFVVDGAHCSRRTSPSCPASTPPPTPAATGAWGPSRRECEPPPRRRPGAGHPRKHQPRLGGAHRHRCPIDSVASTLATRVRGAGRRSRHHHADVRVHSLYRAGLAVGLSLLPCWRCWRSGAAGSDAPMTHRHNHGRPGPGQRSGCWRPRH